MNLKVNLWLMAYFRLWHNQKFLLTKKKFPSKIRTLKFHWLKGYMSIEKIFGDISKHLRQLRCVLRLSKNGIVKTQ